MAKFEADTISDQKRIARGEHWLLARTILRARDRKHHANWKVAILSGAAPAGEINVIRELMPEAHITAVDRESDCVAQALSDGADEGLCLDLGAYTRVPKARFHKDRRLPAGELADRKLDVFSLDLCSGANDYTKDLLSVYARISDVTIVTFSYGRDVTEFFELRCHTPPELASAGVPDMVAKRIGYLLGSYDGLGTHGIGSVILYRGNETPMCSVLHSKSPAKLATYPAKPLSFVRLCEEDFEAAILHPDAARLYDCPQERIVALRRRQAALKAVATRRATAGAK